MNEFLLLQTATPTTSETVGKIVTNTTTNSNFSSFFENIVSSPWVFVILLVILFLIGFGLYSLINWATKHLKKIGPVEFADQNNTDTSTQEKRPKDKTLIVKRNAND